MLPGVGVFGTGLTARVIVPLLKAEGFAVKALWGRTPEEAEELAKEMSVPFYTSRIDEVLLHQDVDLVCGAGRESRCHPCRGKKEKVAVKGRK
uniref:Gfo/Idh/MocA-like oxidoreductase N-terminal domain-containing protein n=1 Tax=Malurus cyaneus samueli TaxID=2593467 RepID=A0A8C5T5Y4_9PASS